MKILLISANITVSPYPIYPLGLSMVASALSGAGHEVRQFDFLEQNKSFESLTREIDEFQPGLIGISVRNIDNTNLVNEQYYVGIVKEIVAAAKKASKVKIVLGGAGFSLIPDLILRETGADYGIIGEGEMLAVKFASDAANGVYPQEKLIGPDIRLSGSDIVSARYDDGLMKYYLCSGNMVSIQTKRGCTQKCIYCSYPVLEGSRIRRRDPVSVVDDIELLRDRHKANYIFFIDSVFNDSEGAYLDLLAEMHRRNVNIPWTGFFKPDGLTAEIVESMKATGLIAVEIGSDAACDLTLKKLGKRFSFQEVIECNELFTSFGISASHYFMFGGPGETKDTVLQGIENVKGLTKCVSFIFMGIRILPNTPLARIAIQEKVVSQDAEMLHPVYYLSPHIEKKWLEETLTEAFSRSRHCIFPPDKVDSSVRMLHKLGYAGTLWDLLIPVSKSRTRHA